MTQQNKNSASNNTSKSATGENNCHRKYANAAEKTTMVLNDVCELIVDCEHKTAPTQEEGYPSIRTPNIGRGYLLLDGVNRVSEETYKRWTARAIPRYGDIIMAREAPVGNAAMVPQGLQPCLGQRTLLIRPMQSLIDSRYLVYLLVGDEIQNMIHSMTNGVTVPHLNMKDVRSLMLPPLPSLPVQKKIAGILSAYDDLIENNQRRIKILEEMAQNLYREWFVKFRFPIFRPDGSIERYHNPETDPMQDSPLGKIPQGWEVKTVFDAVQVLGGGTPKTSIESYWNGNIPFFTPTDATNGVWAFATEKCITEEGLNKCSSRLYSKWTIFITARGTVGKLSMAQRPMAMNQSCYALVGKSTLTQPFTFWAMREAVSGLKQQATGAIFDAIIVDTFKNISLIIPAVRQIVRFDEQVKPILEEVEKLVLKIENFKQTRDLLLPKLISGEIKIGEKSNDK